MQKHAKNFGGKAFNALLQEPANTSASPHEKSNQKNTKQPEERLLVTVSRDDA